MFDQCKAGLLRSDCFTPFRAHRKGLQWLLGTLQGFAGDSPALFGHQRGLSGAIRISEGSHQGCSALVSISEESQRGSTAQLLDIAQDNFHYLGLRSLMLTSDIVQDHNWPALLDAFFIRQKTAANLSSSQFHITQLQRFKFSVQIKKNLLLTSKKTVKSFRFNQKKKSSFPPANTVILNSSESRKILANNANFE
ncbi:hypothetical protein AVEN_224809-1 [Araneus ventricosus]|uniref:Uncharacterized protein n=1 Tax=Araneus ventricosus TaxID=182803 RepID=A0A4Y2FY29_ARAVE|nr:hypothetical protein AVEN_224809-1 [Araneus ventricosus]